MFGKCGLSQTSLLPLSTGFLRSLPALHMKPFTTVWTSDHRGTEHMGQAAKELHSPISENNKHILFSFNESIWFKGNIRTLLRPSHSACCHHGNGPLSIAPQRKHRVRACGSQKLTGSVYIISRSSET